MPILEGKVIRDSFPVNLNSRMRIAEQLREGAGPARTTYFLFSKSGDLPDHTCAERILGGQAEWCWGMLYSNAPAHSVILAKRSVHTHGRLLRYTKCGPWSRQIKMTGQSKLGKTWPVKIIQTDSRMWLRDFLSPSKLTYVSITTYCTLFPPNKYFTHVTTLWEFFWAEPRPCSMIPSLGARIWGSHCPNLASVSGPRTEAPLQAAASWGHLRSIL